MSTRRHGCFVLCILLFFHWQKNVILSKTVDWLLPKWLVVFNIKNCRSFWMTHWIKESWYELSCYNTRKHLNIIFEHTHPYSMCLSEADLWSMCKLCKAFIRCKLLMVTWVCLQAPGQVPVHSSWDPAILPWPFDNIYTYNSNDTARKTQPKSLLNKLQISCVASKNSTYSRPTSDIQ